MAYRHRAKPVAKRPTIAPAPVYSSADLYGSSVGSSAVSSPPKVMATARPEGWNKREAVYYSLSSHDNMVTPKA